MKKSIIRKAISGLLVISLVLGAVQGIISVAGAADDGNYVFNHGDASGCTVFGGTGHKVSTAKDVTKFGDAVAVVPTAVKASGWARIPAVVPSGFDFSKTKGIAAYIKIPEGGSATNFTVRLINKAWSTWFQLGTDTELVFCGTDGEKRTVKQTLPFENMQGYEGYVFIPYEALNAGSKPAVDTSLLNSSNWNVEISCYFTNADCVNLQYCFDQVGYYSDIDKYLTLSNSELVDSNYTFNHGSLTGTAVVGGDGHSVTLGKNISVMGDAVNISPKTVEATGWAQISADVTESGFDFGSTKGIAMCIKLPEGGAATNVNVRLIKKDWSLWYSIGLDKLLTFATVKGTEVTLTTKTQHKPLEDMQGFEGFVFIPYEALSDGSVPAVDKSQLSASGWAVEISLYYTDASCAGLNYYFDEIGYYNDPKSYVNELLSSVTRGNEIINTGTLDGVTADDCDISVQSGATQYGDGISISAPSQATVSVAADVSKSLDFSVTKGIAVYASLPSGYDGGGFGIGINGSKYFAGKGAQVELISSLGSSRKGTLDSSLAGYEGFIFVPYSSMSPSVRASDLTGKTVTLEFSVKNGKYLIDEMGFYSDNVVYSGLPVKQLSVNYIFNDGNVENIKLYSGRDITVREISDASWCGTAAGISPSKLLGAGWAQIPAAVSDSSYKFDATKGIAMYVNIPEMTTDSAMSVRLINKAWTKWFTLGYEREIILVSADGTQRTTSESLSAALAGYEGFVFVPYSSMTEGSQAVDTSLLNGTEWNVEIGYYAKSDYCLGKDYIFDEVGYYSDITGYINTVKAKYSNDIANNGSGAAEASGNGIAYDKVKAAYGEAFDIHPAAAMSDSTVKLPISCRAGFSFGFTTGAALYVKLPDSAALSGLSIALAKKDGSERYTVESNADMTLVNPDGIRREAGGGTAELAGFEGFAFIPYSSFSKNGTDGEIDPSALNNTEWCYEISFSASASALSNGYIFDEFGFYCNISEYLELVKKDIYSVNRIVNDGNTDSVTVKDGNGISAEVKNRSAAYGDVIKLVPAVKNGSGYVNIPASAETGYEYSLVRGIALYAELPEETDKSGLEISIINKERTQRYTLRDDSQVVLIGKDGERSFTEGSVISALKGYRGFVFIPYSSLQKNGTPANAADVNPSGWSAEISLRVTSDEALAATYYVDEIGFYSDYDGYIELCAADLGKSAVEDPDGPADPIAELENGNYIANHGDSLNEVWQNGSIDMEQDNVVSPYGSSVAMYPTETTPSVNTFGAYYITMPEGEALENAKGIAFYMHFPDGGTQTQCQLLLQVDNEVYWVCEDNTEAIVYDMEGNRREELMWYPLADMQGFEGYVFVPFTSMHYRGAGGKTGVDMSLLAGKTVSWRFGHYRWNENELNLKYVVDEIGYYGDEKGYLNLLKGRKADGGADKSGNYILNNCDSESKASVRDASQITVSEKDGAGDSRYALGAMANVAKASQSFVSFRSELYSKDFSKSAGIAMFVSFPSDVTKTNSTVMLAANDEMYYTVKDNAEYSLVSPDGTERKVNPLLSLEDLQGYTGYIFIPFSQFVSKTGVSLKPEALNEMKFELRVSMYRNTKSDTGKDFIFDSIGCYSSITGYLEYVRTHDDPLRPEGGNYLYRSFDSLDGEFNIFDGVSFELVDNQTKMGSAVAVTQTALNTQTFFCIPFSKNTDKWSSSNGLAFYVNIPEGVRNSSGEIFLVNTNEDFWKVRPNAQVTLVNIYGESISSVSPSLPLANLGGYKGWVFIPFDQFINGMGYSGKLEELIDTYTHFELRFGYYKSYQTDVNVPYVYDSVGFYRTISSYLGLNGFEFEEKPADLSYYNNDTDSMGFYLINNVKDMGATVSGTFGIEGIAAEDDTGMKVTSGGEFEIYLNNYRRSDEKLLGTSGVSFYLKNIKDLSKLIFTVRLIDDSNSRAVERYKFDSTVSEFFYESGGRLYVMRASEFKLPDNFEGKVFLPFDNFAPTDDSVPDNLKVDPDSVSTVIIGGDGAAELVLADVCFYSTQDMLNTMIGSPASPFDFTLSANGEGSDYVIISDKEIRLYSDIAFNSLREMLMVSNPEYTVVLTDAAGNVIDSDASVSGDFKVCVMCGSTLIKEYGVTRVTNEFITPERVLVSPAVSATEGKTVTLSQVYRQEFDTESPDFNTGDFFTVKKSAAELIKIVNGQLSVKQIVSVKRILSAFNLFNGIKIRVVDSAGKTLTDDDVVKNGCRIIVNVTELDILNYKVTDVPIDEKTDVNELPTADEEAENSFPWWIVITAGAAVLAGAGIITVAFAVRRKRRSSK